MLTYQRIYHFDIIVYSQNVLTFPIVESKTLVYMNCFVTEFIALEIAFLTKPISS